MSLDAKFREFVVEWIWTKIEEEGVMDDMQICLWQLGGNICHSLRQGIEQKNRFETEDETYFECCV